MMGEVPRTASYGDPREMPSTSNCDVTTVEQETEEYKQLDNGVKNTSKSFQQIVRRTLGKDRLFHLVNSLLKSIDEEKSARTDLIESFEAARRISVPLPKVQLISDRPKRRRRRSEVCLAERIEVTRRMKEQMQKNGEIYDQEREVIGEMEIHAPVIDPDIDNNGNKLKLIDGKHTQDQVQEDHNETKIDSVKACDVEKQDDDDKKSDAETHCDAEKQCDVENPFDAKNQFDSEIQRDADEKQFDAEKQCDNENHIDVEKQCSDMKMDQNVLSNVDKNVQAAGETVSLNGIARDKDSTETCEPKQRSKSLPAGELEKLIVLEQVPSLKEKSELNQMIMESVLRNNQTVDDQIEDNIDGAKEQESVEVDSSEVMASSIESEIPNNETNYAGNDATHYEKENMKTIEVEPDSESDVDKTEETCDVVVGVQDDLDNYNYDSSDSEPDHDPDEMEFKMLNDADFYLTTMGFNDKPPKQSEMSALDPISEAEQSIESTNRNTPRYSSSSSIIEIASNSTLSSKRSKTPKSNNVYINDQRLRKHRSPDRKSAKDNTRRNNRISNSKINYSSGSKSSSSSEKSKAKQKKLISIDLLRMYEENEDLQKVQKKETRSKSDKRRTNTSPTRTFIPRIDKTKTNHRVRRKHDNKPLPPKLIPSPKLYIPDISPPSSRSDLSKQSNKEAIETYRSYQNKKDHSRYCKPDAILWDHLDLVSQKPGYYAYTLNSSKTVIETVTELDDFDNVDNAMTDYPYSRTDNHIRRWNMPVTEAVKYVKSATDVPPMREIDDLTPRPERVQKLYSQFSHVRRSAGHREYKSLNVKPRLDSGRSDPGSRDFGTII